MANTTRHQFQPINGHPSGLKIRRKRFQGNPGSFIGLIVIAGIILAALIFATWFALQLTPAGSDTGLLKKITIKSNSSSSQIGRVLEEQSIIRSAAAFDMYVRIWGKGGSLQAGTYRLSPAESTPQIVNHFVNGSVDEFKITFYPGATLADTTSGSNDKKLDVTSVLKRAGFSDSEITAGLNKTYNSPLFESKPVGADLEGYVYGDTYNFSSGVSVDEILQITFDKFYKDLTDNNLIDKFKARGLNLFKAITLASIIQRESGNNVNDYRQIAQVFYLRLSIDMSLGSDVTYQYIADKTGVPRDTNLDSPYNTRRYKGLPPGPIASPGLSALKAVAEPAEGDFLYFVSGDDGITRFARTSAEHEANVAKYCHVNCSTP